MAESTPSASPALSANTASTHTVMTDASSVTPGALPKKVPPTGSQGVPRSPAHSNSIESEFSKLSVKATSSSDERSWADSGDTSPTSSEYAVSGTSVKFLRGKGFSSDVNVSRCIQVFNVTPEDVISELVARGHDLLSTMVPEPNKLCIIVYLDDTRAAVNMVKDLPGIFAGSRCSFVPTQTVAGVLPVTQARLAMSTLNGQLIMSAKWISDMEDYNLREIFNKCYDAASSYGQIRCLCLTAHDAGGADLRLEFHKLSSVSEMLRSFGIGQVHALTPEIGCSVAFYSPEGPLTHPPMDRVAVQSQYAPVRRPAIGPDPISPSHQRQIPGPSNNGYQSYSSYQYANGAVQPFTSGMMNPHLAGPSHMPHDMRYHREHSAPVAFRDEFAADFHDSPTSVSRVHRGPSDSPHRGQSVDIVAIEEGADVRTTLMLRNLPNRLTYWDVKRVLDATSKGLIDFLYVRVDFATGLNVGYGFVNFVAPEYMIPFLRASVGKPWPNFEANKILEVSYATIQGQECLVQKFRNSSVLQEPEGYTPKIFYTIADQNIPVGKKIGDTYEFPKPDNLQKLNRSLDNARTIGLYNTKDARSARDSRRPRSQFDRGTPRAVRDEAIAAARSIGNGRGIHNAVGVIGHGTDRPEYGVHGHTGYRYERATLTSSPNRLDPQVPGFFPDPFAAYYGTQKPNVSTNGTHVGGPTSYGSPKGYDSLSPSKPRGYYTW